MKKLLSYSISAFLIGGASVCAQGVAANFKNTIIKTDKPSGTVQIAEVGPTGVSEQPAAIGAVTDTEGAEYELFTELKIAPFTVFGRLDSKYVGNFVPSAHIEIISGDPYRNGNVFRTREDEPFTVKINVDGLQNSPTAAAAYKSVNLRRHVQSYGAGGTGENINRNQATELAVANIAQKGDQPPMVVSASANIPASGVPSKVRGEKRFTIETLDNVQDDGKYHVGPLSLDSKTVIVWPVIEGSISGISNGQSLRFDVPALTISAKDVYPESTVWAQVYPGSQRDDTVAGVDAVVVPGTHWKNPYENAPAVAPFQPVTDWGTLLNKDGPWMLELVTETPWGIEYIQRISFTVDRSIKMNGSFTYGE